MIGHQFQVPTEGQAKAEALAAAGRVDLHVVMPSRYREAETRWRTPRVPQAASPGITYHVAAVRFPWSGPAKWYLQWYSGLGALLRKITPDIVDVWEEPWSLLSAQTVHLCGRLLPETRIVSETEQNVLKRLPPPFEQFRAYTFRKADFLIGRNAEAVAHARTRGFSGPARVVGNGFDRELFAPRSREEARERFGIRGFAVGYAGRCVASKGLETLVKGFHEFSGAARSHGDAEEFGLWIAGEGPVGKVIWRNSPRIHSLGPMERGSLACFFSALDVLVLPSLTTRAWKEQFGRVIVEAQGCGTPVVGSSSGAIPEVLGQPELVFPEGDFRALGRLLARLYSEPGWRMRLAEEGRSRALKWYSWEAVAGQMLEIYRQLCADRNGVESF